jgi:hypothetical protein
MICLNVFSSDRNQNVESLENPLSGLAQKSRWVSGVNLTWRDRCKDYGANGDQRAISDLNFFPDTDIRANPGGFADPSAAAHLRSRQDESVATDPYVMRYVGEIIYLRTVLDHCILQRATRDTGVRADLDIATYTHSSQVYKA